ncbi:MAG: thiamine-phosphate kinase [Nitrospirae bacterium]|nr:thiamine-phosphate kinase [Nitrospirota bacterium]MBI3352861.1 thiamine-phosphate kinase [Nitrospirota bacterium]
MRVSKLGERNLLKKISKMFGSRPSYLRVGIGDDAAVVEPRKGWHLVYTTDTLVENIDFNLGYTTYCQIGEKALSANLSDLAAMGAYPKYYLLTLGIPSRTPVSKIMEIFRGLKNTGKKNHVDLIGGDLSEAPVLMIGLTLAGEIKPRCAVLRNGASPGDLIFVTGTIGDSTAGFELLKKKPSFSKINSESRFLMARHLAPCPRIHEGQLLSEERLATAMIDISDGLSTDLLNLTEASHVGADIRVDELPLSPSLVAYGKKMRKNPHRYALSGGEDFELLFTVSPKKVSRIEDLIAGRKIIAKPIGKITSKRGIRYFDQSGKEIKIKIRGYEHFTSHQNQP